MKAMLFSGWIEEVEWKVKLKTFFSTSWKNTSPWGLTCTREKMEINVELKETIRLSHSFTFSLTVRPCEVFIQILAAFGQANQTDRQNLFFYIFKSCVLALIWPLLINFLYIPSKKLKFHNKHVKQTNSILRQLETSREIY